MKITESREVGNKTQVERLHAKDQYCYWCGRLTQLCHEDRNPPPFDAATLEHLRSKFWKRRADIHGLPRTAGMTVLACYQCNQDRSHIEAMFFTKIRGRNDGERTPATPDLKRCQGRLLAAIVRFLSEGGELVGEGSDDVMHWAALVYDEWKKNDAQRKPDKAYRYA